jgi:hypothetical protein
MRSTNEGNRSKIWLIWLMWDRFVRGSTLIFITACHTDTIHGYLFYEPQYIEVIKEKNGNKRYTRVAFPIDFLCPLKLKTIDVPQGSGVEYATNHPYLEYLKLGELSYASLAIFQGLMRTGSESYQAIETSKSQE